MTSISVVIPSWNDGAMLKHCLKAVAAQSRQPDEVVVVDNASNDDTADVARSFHTRLVTESRHGVWPATIAGFDAARGEIIARLDADSVPPADWLARLEALFLEDAAIAGFTGPGDFYGGNRATRWIGEHIYIAGYFWSMGLLLKQPPLFGSNFALRREDWLRVRPRLDPSLRWRHDDLQLSFDLAEDQVVRYVPSLRVGVSARPFSTVGGLVRRLSWAVVTVWANRHRWRLFH